MNLELSSGWAEYAARQFLVHRRVRAPQEIVAAMEAVTLEQVRAAATRMLAGAPASATIGMKKRGVSLLTLVTEPWADYALLDCGHGRKLERYGRIG